MLGTDRPHVLREALMCCRKGGTVSVPSVYIRLLDKTLMNLQRPAGSPSSPA